MTGMLASVTNLAEARQVQEIGVDIIDLKNPAEGALGALAVAEVSRIVSRLGGDRPVSATVGDLPMEPSIVLPAVEAMAATGVDYVKIGFLPGGDWAGVIRSLQPLARRNVRLIAVMFGDESPDLHWLGELAAAGFAGAMLDTRDKKKGSLRQSCSNDFLRTFVSETHSHGLLCGLAGSLRATDIAPLLELKPDYLGFRGALCGGNRVDALDLDAVRAISNLVSGERGNASPRTAA
ncbi:(5-formylfuran-3-yl)methyl phosphate synthase [Methylocaldum sp.]|uniref:(5-formylfuran-3-yl)methyl phosphate synthase n=1 Tax=Methylocaldum sp. TaxID=1969727 RepID=UPI002D55AC61|nr:(5-formylfuran-3-yl)methyl phosphate synthase [Methylocaldum sp.]HYE36881.1 (5-formylfuran-3-yl)methyl phosphate synthase [Methylocaldum sp.]